MNNKKIKLTSANEAKKRMKNSINFLNKSEFVKVDKSEDRILSENIISNFNIPEEDNSAVDGYAFNIKNNEKIFTLSGESKPGSPFHKSLNSTETIKIFTGSNILKRNKINTVVMLEDCQPLKNSVEIKKIQDWSKYQKKGEDVKKIK